MSQPQTAVRALMDNRRTVQIAYSRSDDVHRIAVVVGDDVETAVATVNGVDTECGDALAEQVARYAADYYGLDVSRRDVP